MMKSRNTFGLLLLLLSSMMTTTSAFSSTLSNKNRQQFPSSMRPPSSFSTFSIMTTSSSSTTTMLHMSSADESADLSPVQQQELVYLEMAQNSGPVAKPDVVYILMYNQGTPREGVHTVEYPKGSENDVLLAFESLEECYRFSEMLKADPNWPEEPVPSPTGVEQISQACQQMGLPMEIVPAAV